jgi:hypothetical protein
VAADIKRGRDAWVVEAIRRVIEAVTLVSDVTRGRITSDPEFRTYVERILVSATSAEHRTKIEYYEQLATTAGQASFEPDDDSVRLLDTLDALTLRHLRMLRLASEPHRLPDPDVRNLRTSLASVLRADEDRVDLDWSALKRSGVVTEASAGTPRFTLTEFGLTFERDVLGRPAPMERWLVRVDGPSEDLETLLQEFATPSSDPQLVREIGGIWIRSERFGSLDDVSLVRAEAETFLGRIRLVRRISSGDHGRLELVEIAETKEEGVVVHPQPHEPESAAAQGQADEWPTPAFTPIIERAMASDADVGSVLEWLLDGSWEALVRLVNRIEDDYGGRLTGYPGIDRVAMDLFDAAAVAGSFDRPPPAAPEALGAAITRDDARALARHHFHAWLYGRAGVWRWPLAAQPSSLLPCVPRPFPSQEGRLDRLRPAHGQPAREGGSDDE